MAGPHARLYARGGKTKRVFGGHRQGVVALARIVNRAIVRDRYGIYSRAGIAPLPVRVFHRGGPYRRAKAGDA